MTPLLDRVRARFVEVMGVHERPERLAAAWALGVGIGLSPLLGLHTLLALALALGLRLNKVDVLLGTLVVNPWTLTAYFPAAVVVGRRLVGVPIPRLAVPRPEAVLHLALWRDSAPWLRSVLLAWGVGATVLSLAASAVTYLLLRRLIRAHRARQQKSAGPRG